MDIITKDNYCEPNVCSSGNGALLKKNFLGEFFTSCEKERARKNLGIDLDNIQSSVVSSFLNDLNFVNITNLYNIKNISIAEAILLIPPKYRKEGQLITFVDEEDKWVIYQFKGESVNLWNNYTLWEKLYEVTIINNVTPDNEDLELTSPDEDGNSKIKLKDRLYVPEEYSGKGYKILRKNIVEVVDLRTLLVNTINYLYLDMISKPNTIYEVRYDFDLGGQTITIPNNSALLFMGGSITNGVVNYNNAQLLGLNQNRTFGTFEEKPLSSSGIPLGYAYYCTDKRTSEGDSLGIMIYHKGNNLWSDSLGRIIN